MSGHPKTTSNVDSQASAQLLAQCGVRRACELDLLIFFARHPRSLLSSQSLSAFLGYTIEDITASLDTLQAAGILRRRLTAAHAARLYELLLDGHASLESLRSLLALGCSREGRLALLAAIADLPAATTRA